MQAHDNSQKDAVRAAMVTRPPEPGGPRLGFCARTSCDGAARMWSLVGDTLILLGCALIVKATQRPCYVLVATCAAAMVSSATA